MAIPVKSYWLLAVVAMAAGVPAHAAVYAQAESYVGLLGYVSEPDPAHADADFVHARSVGIQTTFFDDDGNATWGTGPLCGPGLLLDCGGPIVEHPTMSHAAAQANGGNGSLKVRASTTGAASPVAVAQAGLRDHISFLTDDRKVNVRLEIDRLALIAGPNAPDFSLDNDYASLSLLVAAGPIDGGNTPPLLAVFNAFADIAFCTQDPCGLEGLERGFEFYTAVNSPGSMVLADSGSDIPSVYEFDVDFSTLCLFGICPSDTFEIEVRLQAMAGSDGANTGAVVFADKTTFLRIDAPYLSANNYAYIGAPVPLPAAAPMLIGALTPMLLMVRRRMPRAPAAAA